MYISVCVYRSVILIIAEIVFTN